MEQVPSISGSFILLPENTVILTGNDTVIKKSNTLKNLPKPSLSFFENIGENSLYEEYFDENYFSELFLLLYPTHDSRSIYHLQNNLHTLILSKEDPAFMLEYQMSKQYHSKSLTKLFASVGSIHYIYLLFYDWLEKFQKLEYSFDYKNNSLNFFHSYLDVVSIIKKYELNNQINYKSNYFIRQKTPDIFYSILTTGLYIQQFLSSPQAHKKFFQIEPLDFEMEYLTIVKKYILEGEKTIGKDTVDISNEELQLIINSFLLESSYQAVNQKGLWTHTNDALNFIQYIKRFDLLKTMHEQDAEDESEQGGSSDSANSPNNTQSSLKTKKPSLSRKKI